jgi:hypothetical protein
MQQLPCERCRVRLLPTKQASYPVFCWVAMTASCAVVVRFTALLAGEPSRVVAAGSSPGGVACAGGPDSSASPPIIKGPGGD